MVVGSIPIARSKGSTISWGRIAYEIEKRHLAGCQKLVSGWTHDPVSVDLVGSSPTPATKLLFVDRCLTKKLSQKELKKLVAQ